MLQTIGKTALLSLVLLAASQHIYAFTETETTVNIHQGITTDGAAWYANGTLSIHKWNPGTSFSSAPDVSRVDLVSDDPEFSSLGINHWGAPYIYMGKMYTVIKQQVGGCGNNTGHFISAYDSSDLSYTGKTPIGDGVSFQVAGGPVIKNIGGEDYFFLIGCGTFANTIYKFRLPDGKHCDDISCPYGDISLTGRTVNGPQGIFQDANNNWLVVESYAGLFLYDSSGMFQRRMFKSSIAGNTFHVHEGFHIDQNNNLAIAMTYMNPPAPHIYKALETNLDTDIFRYVDVENGSPSGTAISPETALDTVKEGLKLTMPGMILRIRGTTKQSPLRSFFITGIYGDIDHRITYEGDTGPVYITGSINVSESVANITWPESSVPGEFYITTDSSTQHIASVVTGFATALDTLWINDGMDSLTLRSEGTPGNLLAGEWAWGDNDSLGFDTLYYKPATGEDIKTLHMEAGQFDPSKLIRNYLTVRNFKIYFGNQSSIELKGVGNTLENTQVHFSRKYGILVNGINTVISNCAAINNQVGIYVSPSSSNSSIYNCITYKNRSTGIDVGQAQNITIRNCISTENAINQFNLGGAAQATFIAEHNNWTGQNNTGFENYLLWHDVGNVKNMDPQWENPAAGNFRLMQGSPLIDAGTNVGAPTIDYNGDIRPLDGNGDGVPVTDIGLYEYIFTGLTGNGGSSGGCTLLTINARPWRGGDWLVIVLFLMWLGIFSQHSSNRQRS